jgi:phosphomannomutase/phosphoglucomutase
MASSLASGPVSPDHLFGTDGIRKIVGPEINPEFIARVVSAYSRWVDGAGPVLIAHDFRTTSDGIARICAGTLQMHGVDVYEMGEMPTPCLQFNVRALGARAGLMVTASHNPTEFNGIKFAGPDGLEISPQAEALIERGVYGALPPGVGWEAAGRIRRDTRGVERYVTSILASVDRARIRSAHPRVVLDCGNGTSAVTSPQLLSSLGVRLKTLNANPDGGFPGHPSEPSDENLTDLKHTVVESGAEFGVAHDGDSDRVAFVDERGRYVPGEVALALFAQELLRTHPGATIATSITSSTAIEEVVRAEGGTLVVTRSGSLAVAVGVAEHGAVFGGEENGHYYWPAHQNAPDGPMSSAQMVDLLVRTGRPLSEVVDRLPRYVVEKTKVPLPPRVRAVVMAGALEELSGTAERVITLDGVKAFFPGGWLLVRPSGTEPICRVYAESRDAAGARRLVGYGTTLVNELVAAAPGSG